MALFEAEELNRHFAQSFFGKWHTFEQLRSWGCTCDTLTKCDLSKPDKLTVRLRKGVVKPFFEEVVPTLSLAEHLNLEEAAFLFPNDSDPRDVLIKRGNECWPVEITYLGWGYEETLRMELLTESGSAPGFGSIRREKGEIIASLMARRTTDAVSARVCEIIDSIGKKSKKDYPNDTWLLVYCECYDLRGEWPKMLQEALHLPKTSFQRVDVCLQLIDDVRLWRSRS